MKKVVIFCFLAAISVTNSFSQTNLKEQFKTPPFEYRAIAPFQGAGGSKYLETESTTKQLDIIFNKYGYGGIMVAPVVRGLPKEDSVLKISRVFATR